jgi:hypothetical protein
LRYFAGLATGSNIGGLRWQAEIRAGKRERGSRRGSVSRRRIAALIVTAKRVIFCDLTS